MTDRVVEQFNVGAATWNRAAGLLRAVTVALAARLGPVAAGATVLDVACGRGEPGLSLVEATPGVSLVGVDIAQAMIDGADAAARAIPDTRFVLGSAEDLPLDDAAVDAVVSRMGMLGFPGASSTTAHEAFRVLRPGGRLTIAVWDRFSDQTALAASVAACREVAGADLVDVGWMDTLADGRRERWLAEAGFSRIVSEPIRWAMLFPDHESLWAMVSSAPPLAAAFAALGSAGPAAVRDLLGTRLAPHHRLDGSYAIPVSARVIAATKPLLSAAGA